METTALGDIVDWQRARQKAEMEEEVERRDQLLIEALPIEPVVDIVKQPRKPVDPTKKGYMMGHWASQHRRSWTLGPQ